jgi:hypothetical protein
MVGSTVPSTSDSGKKGSPGHRSFWLPRESALGHRREMAQRQHAHPRGARSPPSRLTGGATAPSPRILVCFWPGEGTKWGLGFGAARSAIVLFSRYSRTAVGWWSMTHGNRAHFWPRWAPRLAAQAFAEACSSPGDLGRASLKVWASFLSWFPIKFFFSLVSIFWKTGKIVNGSNLWIIKQIVVGKFRNSD